MAYQSEIDKLKRRYDEKPEQWFAALADAHRKNGEIEQALAIVRSGIKERPNYVSGHIVLGRCLVDKGADDEAEKVFEEVLELDAENIIALKVLGDVAERRGNVEGARRWLERLLEVDPMNEEARETLERVLANAAKAPQPAVITPPDPDVEIVRESAQHPAAEKETFDSVPPEFDVDAAAPVAEATQPPVVELEPPPVKPPAPVEAKAEPKPPAVAPAEPVPTSSVSDFHIERASDPFARTDAPEEDLSELLDTGTKVVSFDTPEGDQEAPSSQDEVAPLSGLIDSSAELSTGSGEKTDAVEEVKVRDDRSTEVADLEAQDLSWLTEVAASSWPADQEDRAVEEEVDVELVESDTQPIPSSAVTDLRASGEPPAIEAHAPVAESVAPASGSGETTPPAPEDPDGVVTETMAEVFAAQGLIDQARDVYLKLLRQRPTDESIRHKLVELEQRRKTQAPRPPAAAPADRASSARTVSASETGGTSVRSLFSDLLSKRPTAANETPVAATPTHQTPDPKSVVGRKDVDTATRAAEPGRAGVSGSAPANRGEPTRPAGDEVSLASVFGDQGSADEAAAPHREEKVAPKADAGASEMGMTFDRFFGGSAEEAKVEEAPPAAEDDDEDFKAWLQGLKS